MQVAVIEDQALVRDYLAALLRRQFSPAKIVTVGSMAELETRRSELEGVDLILFDVELGDGTTLDWAVQRSQSAGRGALVALSSIPGAFPFKQLQAANISLVHKNDGEAELLNVIRQSLTGAVVVSRGVMAIIQSAGRDPSAATKLLTPKELRVLALLGQRLSNDEIAEVLGCSVATVTDHRKRVMNKLDLHSIEQIIDYAIRHGVIHDSPAARARVRRPSSAGDSAPP
jgi:DNA-binding NarL/FixJ family response regulator